jgi:hypothetical protein
MEDITVSECFNLSDLHQPPTKKTKTKHFAPSTTVLLETQLGKSTIHKVNVLFESGSFDSMTVAKFVKKLHIQNDTKIARVVDKRRNLSYLRQVQDELHSK